MSPVISPGYLAGYLDVQAIRGAGEPARLLPDRADEPELVQCRGAQVMCDSADVEHRTDQERVVGGEPAGQRPGEDRPTPICEWTPPRVLIRLESKITEVVDKGLRGVPCTPATAAHVPAGQFTEPCLR